MDGDKILVSLRDTVFHPSGSVPRIARTRPTAATDYISPWLLRAVPVYLGLGAFLLATASLMIYKSGLNPELSKWMPGLVTLGIATVTVVACMLVTRHVVSAQQPSTGTAELVWDDAMTQGVLNGASA